MARQFKLRLGDGTVLVVDQDGLATWLIDDKAMAQPAGSRQWYPLKDVVAEVRIALRAEEAARAKAAAPRSADPAPAAAPVVSPVAPPKPAPAPAVSPVASPKPAPRRPPEDDLPLVVERALSLELGQPEAVTPLAEATTTLRTAAVNDDVAVIRLKPLDDDELPQEEEFLEELEPVEEDPKGWPKAKAVLEAKAQPIVDTATAWVAREGWREIPGKVAAAAAETRSTASRAPRSWRMGAAVAGGLAVVVAAVLLTRSLWGPAPPPKVAYRPPLSVPTPVPEASLSPEAQAAVSQLPHLSTQTVRRIMSTGIFEPSEMFRAGHAASRRGLDALTPDEVLELGRLERAALAGLRSGDRARVRAYDRISAGRDLLAGEDARVLGLVARGARALSPPRRERLQVLLGKAIDAGLGSRPAVSPRPATVAP